MATLYTNGHDKNIKGAGIAKNSLVSTKGRLLALKSGYVDVAVAGDKVIGISKEDKTFASDNETGAKTKVTYLGLDEHMEFKSNVVSGTIAQANVGSIYDLDANGDVDASAVSPTQLELVKVVSDSVGIFKIAK